MKKGFSLLLGVCVLAGAQTAGAQITQVFNQGGLTGTLTTHDFESGPGGPGATYSSGNRVSACSFTGCVTSSGSWGLASNGFPDVLTITFTNAVGSVGMFFGNDDVCCAGVFTAHLDAYNGDGLIGGVDVVANMNDFADQYIGLNSTTAITYATLQYGNGDVQLYDYVDDVSFGTVASPEPATIGLVATGLIGIGGFARRKRRLAA